MLVAFKHTAEKFALNPIKVGRSRLDAIRIDGDHVADPADPQPNMFFTAANDNIAIGVINLHRRQTQFATNIYNGHNTAAQIHHTDHILGCLGHIGHTQ